MEFIVSGVIVKTMTGHCSKSVLLKWPVLQESKNIPSYPIYTKKYGKPARNNNGYLWYYSIAR